MPGPDGSKQVDDQGLDQWAQLKRLSFVLDDQVKKDLITGPSLSDPDKNGVRYMSSGKTTGELDQVHQLVYDLELVSPKHDWMAHEQPEKPNVRELDLDATGLLITGIFRGDRFIDGLLASKVRAGLVQRLCRHAYALTMTKDGWPTHLPVLDDGTIRVGMVVKSLSGRMEGRTIGGRQRCPSHQCNGWLIGVHWEDGQRLRICTEGWHYDPVVDEIRVIGGGEISARFISPKPLGRQPLPKREWPTRAELLKSRSWSVQSNSKNVR